MKPPFKFYHLFLAVAVIGIIAAPAIMLLPGCATSGSGGVDTNFVNFAKSLVATNGIVTAVANEVVTVETQKLVSQAIAKDPASKAYFIDGQNAINLLINGGNVSAASLSKSLNQIPVKGPSAPIIQAGITSLIGAYQQAEAVTVTQKIDTVPYLSAFLAAVNTGITLAIQ